MGRDCTSTGISKDRLLGILWGISRGIKDGGSRVVNASRGIKGSRWGSMGISKDRLLGILWGISRGIKDGGSRVVNASRGIKGSRWRIWLDVWEN